MLYESLEKFNILVTRKYTGYGWFLISLSSPKLLRLCLSLLPLLILFGFGDMFFFSVVQKIDVTARVIRLLGLIDLLVMKFNSRFTLVKD